MFNTGKNRHLVRFLTRRGKITLPWTPSVELRLDIGFGELKASRTAIDNCADTDTVRFTKSAYTK
jgi:hypothetical protein